MHFPVIINVRKDSRKSNPERHGAESDGFWIIRNDGRGDIAERNGQCRNAKNAVRHLPCVFVLNCPWQTKSRMPVERQPGRNHSRKNNDDGDNGSGENIFSAGRQGDNAGFCQRSRRVLQKKKF